MAGPRMQFDFTFRASRDRAPRDEDQPMRILVLADLSGHARAAKGGALGARKPLRIDVDNADAVMKRIAPSLSVTLPSGGPGETLELSFSSLDDFHPDALYRRLPIFGRLRDLRDELNNPASFARAAAALGVTVGAAAAPAPAAPAAEGAAGDVERLLGRAPSEQAPAAPDVVDRLVRQVVQPHVVPDTAAAQREAFARLDAEVAGTLRALLHAPEFQRLEATWRGVWKLATELETGETLKVALLDVGRDELDADMSEHADDLSRSALYGVLRGPDTEPPDGAPWTLAVADFAFGPGERDVATLSALGAVCANAGTALLAQAGFDLFGVAAAPGAFAAGEWPELEGATAARWRQLRESAQASSIALAAPRVLGRLPYGARTEPVDSFAFEEAGSAPAHGDYLWVNPAYSLAFLAASGFTQEGWSFDLDDQLEIADLPSHILRDEHGSTRQQPCAEALIPDRVAMAMLERGVMPVVSARERNLARLPRWQSVAAPPKPLAGAWSRG